MFNFPMICAKIYYRNTYSFKGNGDDSLYNQPNHHRLYVRTI